MVILKKTVAFLLALVMVVTMVPLSALAMETEPVGTLVPDGPLADEADAAETVPETTAPAETIGEITVEETAEVVDADGTVTASGTCGENLTWTLVDGVLTISGQGDMEHYGNEDHTPWAEYGDSITSVVIDTGVSSIPALALKFDNVTEISVNPENQYYSSVDGVLFNKSKTELCSFPKGKEGTYQIPQGVLTIHSWAFARSTKLTAVIVSEGVQKIESSAFYSCSALQSIVLPESLAYIGYSAFTGTSIQKLTIPKNVSKIDGPICTSCFALTDINVAEENGYYTSIDGVLFTKDIAQLIQYPAGKTAKRYEIPEGVREIKRSAMSFLEIEEVVLPESVSTIEFAAFQRCSASDIYFLGDAPKIEDSAFNLVWANCHYPDNNDTWTEEVRKTQYGHYGKLTWVPYASDDETESSPCALSELTELDYLAFSAIAYLPFASEGTVKENLKGNGYWDKVWSEDQGITYAELCDHIANWEVVTKHDLSSYNGFYAVSFGNKDKEIVIAYRGSVPPEQWAENDWDAVCDWLLNDLPIALGNTMGIQLDSALDIYENIALSHSVSQIAVTGHSLGGAWADAISAYSGCKGVTFNAVSILDVLYKHIPEKMAAVFEGADRWQFVDHTNQYDVLAGMFEKYTSTKMKPYIAHKSNIPISVSIEELLEGLLDDAVEKNLDAVIEGSVSASTGTFMGFVAKSIASSVAESVLGDIAKCHGLQSFVVKTNDGAVKLTEEDHRFIPSKKITNYMLTANHSVDFGSTRKDEVDEDWTILVPRTSYGGNEDDKILTSWQNDHLIGGKGNADVLDGSWGDDVYIYYPGDGYDEIHDVSGNDTLKLCNTKRTDDVVCVLSDDGEYVYIYCAGEHIAGIRAKNRAEGDNTFIIEWGDGIVTHVTSYLHRAKYSSAINIQCPVSVEILDAEGNAVYTLKDGEAGSFYTDYGNFYVCKEKNGSYSKTLDLVEGYTVKIIGEDEGTMDIAYRKVENGQLSEVQQLSDIPVSNGFTAVLEENETGEIQLTSVSDAHPYRLGDANHDGSINAKDSTRILQYSVGALDEAIFFCENCAKVSNDDDINAKDSTLILQYSVGQRTDFPAQK